MGAEQVRPGRDAGRGHHALPGHQLVQRRQDEGRHRLRAPQPFAVLDGDPRHAASPGRRSRRGRRRRRAAEMARPREAEHSGRAAGRRLRAAGPLGPRAGSDRPRAGRRRPAAARPVPAGAGRRAAAGHGRAAADDLAPAAGPAGPGRRRRGAGTGGGRRALRRGRRRGPPRRRRPRRRAEDLARRRRRPAGRGRAHEGGSRGRGAPSRPRNRAPGPELTARNARRRERGRDRARLRKQRDDLAGRSTAPSPRSPRSRKTARGVVVSLPDILFDTNKATLKQNAQVALAKLAGIVSVFPNINLRVEGHTDSTGTDAINVPSLAGPRERGHVVPRGPGRGGQAPERRRATARRSRGRQRHGGGPGQEPAGGDHPGRGRDQGRRPVRSHRNRKSFGPRRRASFWSGGQT